MSFITSLKSSLWRWRASGSNLPSFGWPKLGSASASSLCMRRFLALGVLLNSEEVMDSGDAGSVLEALLFRALKFYRFPLARIHEGVQGEVPGAGDAARPVPGGEGHQVGVVGADSLGMFPDGCLSHLRCLVWV